MPHRTTLRLPALKISGEGGWADLEFHLLGHEMQDEDGFHLFCAAAHHDGRPLAFNILWPTIWNFDPPRGAPRGVFSHNGNIAFVNAQPLEKNFLEILAQLYDVPAPKHGMANFTEVSAVSMRGDPERVLNETVTLKLLFGAHEESEIPYAEAYLTIDFPNRTVLLHEKDPEWRGAIVAGLELGTVDDHEAPQI